MPVASKIQTLKQAKASFKARGQPSISEKEKKQLERASELQKRAQRAKELEQRRVTTAEKKADRDRKDQEEFQLGTQRRCDRFGNKSSQFHLGAFWRPLPPSKMAEASLTLKEDGFEDDFVDDSTLLDILGRSEEASNGNHSPARSIELPLGVALNLHQQSTIDEPERSQGSALADDPDCCNLWDQFDSSTQIARDLDTDANTRRGHSPDSFGSSIFDLTKEDIAMIDLVDAPTTEGEQGRPVASSHIRGLQSLPAKAPKLSNEMPEDVAQPPKGLNDRKCASSTEIWSSEFGFTTSQLEILINDDIQLTQIECG